MLFFLFDGAAVVNLAEAVGVGVRTPYNALDQPDDFLNGSKFCLPGFFGRDKKTTDGIVKFFLSICEGTSLTMPRGLYSQKNCVCLDIKCTCGRMNRYMKDAVFEDGMNARAGVKPEEIKRKRTENEEHIIQKMPKWDSKRGISRDGNGM